MTGPYRKGHGTPPPSLPWWARPWVVALAVMLSSLASAGLAWYLAPERVETVREECGQSYFARDLRECATACGPRGLHEYNRSDDTCTCSGDE